MKRKLTTNKHLLCFGLLIAFGSLFSPACHIYHSVENDTDTLKWIEKENLPDTHPAPAIAFFQNPEKESAYPGTGFIVHEWGTFTSVQGSDGMTLEWRSGLGEDLPSFVYDLSTSDLQEQIGPRGPLNTKTTLQARQRMETPVTYFYTKEEKEVEVSVTFPEGLLTEWYPRVRNLRPDLSQSNNVKDGFLDWGFVKLFPQEQFPALWKELPTTNEESNHYYHARETDSAFVRTCKNREEAEENFEIEKYLFYRGVGNFLSPLRGFGVTEEKVHLVNVSDDILSHMFLVDIQGTHASVQFVENLKVGEELVLSRNQDFSKAEVVEALSVYLENSLVQSGLYTKEAKSMVKTWKDSWFDTDGLRVLYLLPEKQTNKIIPLHINPAPEKMVRIMVGRLELLTPEEESDMAAQLETLEPLNEEQSSKLAQNLLTEYGRFALPLLERVATQKPSLQKRAETLSEKIDVLFAQAEQAITPR